jgi:uroporphyrinogen-III decarboxylase
MDDYERILPTLFPDPTKTIESMAGLGEAQRRGEAVSWISLEGYFWVPRTLLGIQPHFYAFYDEPELMHRINHDLAERTVEVLGRLAKVCPPTFMTFAEDMSYNHGPMLSRELFEEFLAPYYRRVVPVLREMGTTVLVDTDGDVTEMIPWLTEVGVQGVLPLERQAGVDAGKIRAAHPEFLMIGHFDKMVMPHGREAMRAEFERLLPVMRSGGFIPSVDHQTPPGVSLSQYRDFLELLREYTDLVGVLYRPGVR